MSNNSAAYRASTRNNVELRYIDQARENPALNLVSTDAFEMIKD